MNKALIRLRKLLLVGLLLLLFVMFILVLTVFSRPGDMFYFARVFMESNIQSSVDESFSKKLITYKDVLVDRIQSYKMLDSERNCLQMNLAEDEVLRTLQSFYSLKSDATAEDGYSVWLDTFSQVSEELASFRPFCVSNLPVTEIHLISMLDKARAGVKLDAWEVNKLRGLVGEKYLHLQEASKNFQFRNQDELTAFTDLLLVVKGSVSIFGYTQDNLLQIYLGSLAATNAEILLSEGQEAEYDNFDTLAWSICTLNSVADGRCGDDFPGIWNSVNAGRNIVGSLQSGKKIAMTYIETYQGNNLNLGLKYAKLDLVSVFSTSPKDKYIFISNFSNLVYLGIKYQAAGQK